jgi:hypothetical protein
MTLLERVSEKIQDFQNRHPEFDGVGVVTRFVVEKSNRGDGPDISLYVHTESGIGFEVVLQPGDDVRGAMDLTQKVH